MGSATCRTAKRRSLFCGAKSRTSGYEKPRSEPSWWSATRCCFGRSSSTTDSISSKTYFASSWTARQIAIRTWHCPSTFHTSYLDQVIVVIVFFVSIGLAIHFANLNQIYAAAFGLFALLCVGILAAVPHNVDCLIRFNRAGLSGQAARNCAGLDNRLALWCPARKSRFLVDGGVGGNVGKQTAQTGRLH